MAGGRGVLGNQSESVRPQIMNFDEGDEVKQDEGAISEEEEEGQKTKLRAIGKPPSQKEFEEHMALHLPYRSWCRHCVSGRGQSDHHRKQLGQEDQEIPVISIDYAYLGDAKREDETKVQPIIVIKDRKKGTIKAHMLEEKGVNAYAIKRVGQDIGLMGYKKIILKSDNEPAIIALKSAVKTERPEEIIMEESPVGESAVCTHCSPLHIY